MGILSTNLEARYLFEQEDYRGAIDLLQISLNLGEGEAGDIHLYIAECYNQLRKRLKTIEHANAALEHKPGQDEVFKLLAKAKLPGPSYRLHIEDIHKRLAPKVYVEIGIYTGDTLKMAAPGTLVIGIDPVPKVSMDLMSKHHIFACTSDDFFDNVAVPEVLRDRKIDLAFVDGLHEFDQVVRDVLNLEQHAHEGTTLLIHDCLPTHPAIATRDRQTGFWSGDVWKALLVLKEMRPDLDISVLPTFPTGLGVVKMLNPSAPKPDKEQIKAACDKWMSTPFESWDALKESGIDFLENRVGVLDS